jgi:hypothetical protein
MFAMDESKASLLSRAAFACCAHAQHDVSVLRSFCNVVIAQEMLPQHRFGT